MGSTRACSIIVPGAQTADQSPLMKTNAVVAAAVEGRCRAPPTGSAVVWLLAAGRWWPMQNGRLDNQSVSLGVAR